MKWFLGGQMTEEKNTQISRDILALTKIFFDDYQAKTKKWEFEISETQIFLKSDIIILFRDNDSSDELNLRVSMSDVLKNANSLLDVENYMLSFTFNDSLGYPRLLVELENKQVPGDKILLDDALFSSEEFDIISVFRYYFNLINTD